jgi:hypothetical protein
MIESQRIRIYANRWFAKFVAKEKISDATLAEAVHRAESGLLDADLGGASSSSVSRGRARESRAATARS